MSRRPSSPAPDVPNVRPTAQAAAAAEELEEVAAAVQSVLLSKLQSDGPATLLLPENNPLNFTPRDPRKYASAHPHPTVPSCCITYVSRLPTAVSAGSNACNSDPR